MQAGRVKEADLDGLADMKLIAAAFPTIKADVRATLRQFWPLLLMVVPVIGIGRAPHTGKGFGLNGKQRLSQDAHHWREG